MSSDHQQSSAFPRLIWFLLLDSETGKPYRNSSVSSIEYSLITVPVIDQFRQLVHRKNSNKLTGIDASDLLVYKNKAAFYARNNAEDDVKEQALDPTEYIGVLGSVEDMLVVVVPQSMRTVRGSTESPLAREEPSNKRKQRWKELNEILERNAKKSKTNDSTAYSFVTWNQVKSVFSPETYVQPTRDMDAAQLDFLARYLSFTTGCLGPITTGKEAKRLHFIAPVLICVCILFNGDVNIAVEEELVGNFVRAHGNFEFMLTRGNKAVCIVEAKRDDVEQGMAQDLLGCEVAAEVGGLDVVYGIVTNYVQWNFLCSRNDKVEMEECSLCLLSNGPEMNSLKRIAEKIYSMLSD
eukprot:CAMPEP_0171346544 /NCGR_PEP_ID=MMETSP0878-20121228/25128_1 /TAXON_ID=67004 /ORGANISM="Thalassiosira weissflogii, Strain CCMP1336" /LENGTH=351 /DNA_ID=CAMNT_0011850249 /DNA_START=41 /DNA_END=1096 /DNA_ORIENTATION=+